MLAEIIGKLLEGIGQGYWTPAPLADLLTVSGRVKKLQEQDLLRGLQRIREGIRLPGFSEPITSTQLLTVLPQATRMAAEAGQASLQHKILQKLMKDILGKERATLNLAEQAATSQARLLPAQEEAELRRLVELVPLEQRARKAELRGALQLAPEQLSAAREKLRTESALSEGTRDALLKAQLAELSTYPELIKAQLEAARLSPRISGISALGTAMQPMAFLSALDKTFNAQRFLDNLARSLGLEPLFEQVSPLAEASAALPNLFSQWQQQRITAPPLQFTVPPATTNAPPALQISGFRQFVTNTSPTLEAILSNPIYRRPSSLWWTNR